MTILLKCSIKIFRSKTGSTSLRRQPRFPLQSFLRRRSRRKKGFSLQPGLKVEAVFSLEGLQNHFSALASLALFPSSILNIRCINISSISIPIMMFQQKVLISSQIQTFHSLKCHFSTPLPTKHF